MIQRSHLERGRRVCEIKNLDMTLCGANYHERIRYVERVAALWQLHSRDRIWCAHVPILDPTRRNKRLGLKQESWTRITLIVLSHEPVARMLPWGVSSHLTTLTGASCWATCCACPVWMSKRRAALSPPPEIILFPSYRAWFGRIQTRISETCVLTLFQQTDRTGAWCPYIAFPCVWPFCPTSYIRTYEGH